MVTYKTKKTVITDALNPEALKTAYASIDNINIDSDAWIASGQYYTLDDSSQRVELQTLTKGFTPEEVAQLESQLGITADNSPEAIQKLIVAAMPLILSQEKIFGLTAADWVKV
jgi:hypothetical protein